MDSQIRRERLRAIGVVLAAGSGRRYGRPKILAEHGRWLESAINALADGGCAAVWVTTGAARPPIPAPALELYVPEWFHGLSQSVRAAVAAASTAGTCHTLVLHIVDTPDVGADVVARLLSVHSGVHTLARVSFRGVPGHPVAIGRSHWPALTRSLTGDTGAGNYLRTHNVHLVECGDLATGADIDWNPQQT
ncbi:nucleotidyltransferase family protein [Hoyosella altamirensis]|uniref:Nicotine blue oxidoreductase n=1 Tax=Hoyosella altamirensis TaxID=616997 RepID=A0A839RTU0_9ACTN|nr:NTP transferase domain-containing protein [Hoyosella altamirensis]MBB3039484.1 nicotine blue oxidoreductase [Hoyosella altamirensis]